MPRNSNIGPKIREFRKERQLTIQELAQKAGLSASYISQVETEKVSPSIAALKKIGAVLEVRTVDFFADELIEDPMVLPPGLWTRVLLPGWDAEVKQMVHIVGNKRMQPFHTTVPPGGGTHENYSHPGEEFGFVLSGTLTLKLGNEIHELKTGWAVYFSSLIPHSWENNGNEPCHLIWVVSPPSW